MSSLFRKQALDAQGRQGLGPVVLATPLSSRIWTAAAVLIVAMLVLFLCTASYARRETVSGFLSTDQGVLRVYAGREGVIDQILVSEGERVNRGDVLMTLRSDPWTAGHRPFNQLLLSELESEKQNVEAELKAERSLAARRTRQLERDGLAEQSRLEQLDRRRELARQQLTIRREQEFRGRRLVDQGHLSQRDWQALQLAGLEAGMLLEALELESIAIEQKREQIRSALQRVPLELSQTESRLRSRLSQLNQELLRGELSSGVSIRAPRSGRVTAISLSPGQRTSAAQPLASIVPAAAPLVARLLVPTRSAGFLRPGQVVQIRLDAFPYQKYGMQRARISEISSTVMAASQLPPAAQLAEPSYLVTARIDRPYLGAKGEQLSLRPEMRLAADIVLDRRRVVEWLFEPLIAARRRSGNG
ncbi:MAG: HlyD family efflux transporter periplasmic adaptor subunit [Xanthomonadales bacterium]|nr:HlyD family efflux transporter periplasmic adaptor subunit [Xanthomonadales bacterium]